ncbi:hypothetical protein AC1031_004314 [Aphanomyces cochlioides]|nr:hypothetical protein AC1031_004314 [Aphanomyces cochlioides]
MPWLDSSGYALKLAALNKPTPRGNAYAMAGDGFAKPLTATCTLVTGHSAAATSQCIYWALLSCPSPPSGSIKSELNIQLPMPREVVNMYGQVQPEVWTSNERDLLIEHFHYIDFDNRVEPKAIKGQFHEWPFDIPTIEPLMKYDLLEPNFELVEDSRPLDKDRKEQIQ